MFYSNKIEIETDLNAEEIIFKLNSLQHKNKKLGQYDIFILYPQFNCKQILKYRNSFAPYIVGNINSSGNKKILTLRISLDKIQIIIVGFLMFIPSFIIFLQITNLINLMNSNIKNFIPVLLVLSIVLPYLAFKFESFKIKNDFYLLFGIC